MIGGGLRRGRAGVGDPPGSGAGAGPTTGPAGAPEAGTADTVCWPPSRSRNFSESAGRSRRQAIAISGAKKQQRGAERAGDRQPDQRAVGVRQ